jgi:hypothetical protein
MKLKSRRSLSANATFGALLLLLAVATLSAGAARKYVENVILKFTAEQTEVTASQIKILAQLTPSLTSNCVEEPLRGIVIVVEASVHSESLDSNHTLASERASNVKRALANLNFPEERIFDSVLTDREMANRRRTAPRGARFMDLNDNDVQVILSCNSVN